MKSKKVRESAIVIMKLKKVREMQFLLTVAVNDGRVIGQESN
jgi:hypothetical protein